MGLPIFDPTNKSVPEHLLSRPLYVREDGLNTYRLMFDESASIPRWIDEDVAPWAAGTNVKYLINGAETFAEMAEAMKTATGEGHFIYLLGWYLGLDTPLGGGDTCRTLFTAAAAAGVQVRAMLWRNTIMTRDQRARRIFLIGWRGHGDSPGTLPHRAVVMPIEPPPAPPPTPGLRFREDVFAMVDVSAAEAKFLFASSVEFPAEVIDPPIPHNTHEVAFIDGLALPAGKAQGHCAAILDAHVPVVGAHHQKMLVVNGSRGLIAFAGGIDINNDRLRLLYDVHSRVEGPAAWQLLQVFNERWRDHPDTAAKSRGQPHLGDSVPRPIVTSTDQTRVQVARTYAKKRPPESLLRSLSPDPRTMLLAFLRHEDPFRGYNFAPDGALQSWVQLKSAIEAAQRFIYIENQYFVSTQLAGALAAALPRLRHITMLLCASSDVDNDYGYARTKVCLDILTKADPTGQKVRVFAIDPAKATLNYIHSKTFVFDDEFAIISSANGCRRSYTCDSEVGVGIFDDLESHTLAFRFAHRLRIRLWALALNMDTEEGHAALADGVAAVAHWRNPPPGALVDLWERLIPRRGAPSDDLLWNGVRDPFPDKLP